MRPQDAENGPDGEQFTEHENSRTHPDEQRAQWVPPCSSGTGDLERP